MKNNDITIEEMKELEIEILEKIDELCKKNNLKYSLMDGSLIGVIRHKGFIPWDDDIDIMMPRPDYEKLKQIMIDNPIDGLKYMSSELQNDFYYPYAKVVSTKTTVKEYKAKEIKDYGIFVDIFPIDGVYNNKILRFIQRKMVIVLRNIIQISFHDEQISTSNIKKIIKNIVSYFSKLVGLKRWVKLTQKIIKSCDYTNSKLVTIVYDGIYTKKGKCYTKEMFENVSDRSFENRMFSVIDCYDKYLMDFYGDYMKLPPKESQKPNHSFDILKWKEGKM